MGDPGPSRVEWLTVAGEVDRWRSLGLTVAGDGLVRLTGTCLRVVDGTASCAPSGIVSWALSGTTPAGSIDGLVTDSVPPLPPSPPDHDLGASGIDHVVVLTPDLERTSTAIADATGYELRRIREVGTMRQGFHRIGRGGLIAELVERPDVPAGEASFWGLVLTVDDLDAACERLGPDRVGGPKDAVQPGRRIATVRDRAGLGVPVALMSR